MLAIFQTKQCYTNYRINSGKPETDASFEIYAYRLTYP